MAKRFTDTGKWDKAFFDGLSLKLKVVWIYLCDKCDHAGIWDVNYRQMSFHLGERVTADDLREFGDRLCYLSPTKIFIPAFVEFQYGELNPENRAHLSVINRLKKEGAYKALTSSIQGAKDKEKDKDSSFGKGAGKTFSGQEFFESLPVLTQDTLSQKYKREFLIEAAEELWLYHSSDPAHTNWPVVKWGKLFVSWVTEKRRREVDSAKKPNRTQAPETGGWEHVDGVS